MTQPAVDIDPALRELAASGFSLLASEVAGLQPQKTEPVPGVLRLQQRYARVAASPLTAAFSGPLVVNAPLPDGQPVEVQVTFDIMQAPSTFGLPVMQKRPWDPPFQVHMTWRCALPLQFSTRVAAFVADEDAVTSMLTWQVPSTADAAKQLQEHQQERMVVLAPGRQAGDEPPIHAAEAVFTFSKLSFGAPSSMRPRWLVFAASLLGGGCVYSHYLVPTVVMSRLAEQYDKAKRVLWGNNEPVGEAAALKMDYRQLRKYISKELEKVGIQREPSEADFRYLATRAGFVVGADSVRSSSASTAELASFKQWFGGHVVMLKHIRTAYERAEPQVVCGFGVTREQADALLSPHPKGTFLLRFGSQGGQLVLSVRSSAGGSRGAAGGSGPATTHYSLNTTSLQHNGLEVLLERNGTAEQLLDAITGHLHSRVDVLDRSYLQAVDLNEARKRYRRPGGDAVEADAESPPPPALLPARPGASDSIGAGPAASLSRSMSMPVQEGSDAWVRVHQSGVPRSLSRVHQQSPAATVRQQQYQQQQQQQQQYQQQQQQQALDAGAASLLGFCSMQLDGPACSWDGGAPQPDQPQLSLPGSYLAAVAAFNPYQQLPLSASLMVPSFGPEAATAAAMPMDATAASGCHSWPAQAALSGMGLPPPLPSPLQQSVNGMAAPSAAAGGALPWASPGLTQLMNADRLGPGQVQQQQPWSDPIAAQQGNLQQLLNRSSAAVGAGVARGGGSGGRTLSGGAHSPTSSDSASFATSGSAGVKAFAAPNGRQAAHMAQMSNHPPASDRRVLLSPQDPQAQAAQPSPFLEPVLDPLGGWQAFRQGGAASAPPELAVRVKEEAQLRADTTLKELLPAGDSCGSPSRISELQDLLMKLSGSDAASGDGGSSAAMLPSVMGGCP